MLSNLDFAIAVRRPKIIAGCKKCEWYDQGEKVTKLAESGALHCFNCGEPAKLYYDPEGWPPHSAKRSKSVGSEGIPEAVHEGVARSEEGAR